MELVPDGPMLVEGPVDVVLEDGTVASSQRFTVAVCVCRRSGTYPWCDTSHRRHVRAGDGSASDNAESRQSGADTGEGTGT